MKLLKHQPNFGYHCEKLSSFEKFLDISVELEKWMLNNSGQQWEFGSGEPS